MDMLAADLLVTVLLQGGIVIVLPIEAAAHPPPEGVDHRVVVLLGRPGLLLPGADRPRLVAQRVRLASHLLPVTDQNHEIHQFPLGFVLPLLLPGPDLLRQLQNVSRVPTHVLQVPKPANVLEVLLRDLPVRVGTRSKGLMNRHNLSFATGKPIGALLGEEED